MSFEWRDGLSASSALVVTGYGRVRLRLSILRETWHDNSRWGAWVERETPERSWVIVADDGGGYQHASREDAKRCAEWMSTQVEYCSPTLWALPHCQDAIAQRAVDAAIGRRMVKG